MSRKNEVLLALQPMDQKQFFFYVQVKLQEAIAGELKLGNPVGFFKKKEFESSVSVYKTKLNELVNMLQVSVENFPANAFKIICTVVEMMNPDHRIFKEVIPLDLVKQRYGIFLTTIAKPMNSVCFKKFNFLSLPIEDQKKVIDFLMTYICRNEMFKENVLKNLQDAKDPLARTVATYLLFEATIEYVRMNVENRKNIIVDAFFKSGEAEQLQYDTILADYERASHYIKAYITPPVVLPPKPKDIVAHDSSFDYVRIKNACNEILTQCIQFYANKLLNNQVLDESEIQHAQQMKVLRTVSDGLHPQNNVDQRKIVTILKYILQDAWPDGINKQDLLSHCVSDAFLKLEPDANKRKQMLPDAFNEFSKKVEEKDLALFKKELLKTSKSPTISAPKSVSKSGLFSPRNNVDDKSEEESAGPPKRSRTKTPPPRG